MALAAIASRTSGLLAKIFIVGVLSFNVVNDSYTLANTLPNIVFELLIGGVLTSVAIPLLSRAQRSDADGGQAYAQQIFTVAAVCLAAATLLAVVAAPVLIDVYLSNNSRANPQLATTFAYLLLPQIFFYGIAALFGAILNTKERFAAPAWAPVANNALVIVVAVWIGLTNGGLNQLIGGSGAGAVYADPTTSQILILGIGTTAGIVLQATIMLPSLLRSGFRFKWRFALDARMREAGSLAVWAIGYVLVSQAGYIVLTNIAGRAPGGLSTFSYASLLFQTPYGILGVSLLTAIMPRMSRHAAAGDMELVKDDMSLANRLSAVALLPVSGALLALAGAVGVLSSGYGKATISQAQLAGITCAALAIGLVPLAMTLVQMRVFYAMKDGRTPVLINAIMVAVRIPLLFCALLLKPASLIPGLAVATAISYIVGAIVGEVWLRHRFGPMGSRRALITIGKMAAASALGGAAAWGVVQVVWGGFPNSWGAALAQFLVGGTVGVVVILLVALALKVEELEPVKRRLIRVVRGRRVQPGTVTETDNDTPAFDAGPREQVIPPVSGDASTPESPGSTPPAAVAPESDPAVPDPAVQDPADQPPDILDTTALELRALTVSAATLPTGSAGLTAASTRPNPALAPGAMIGGRYRLVSLIAVDASGNRFWRAKDTVLPRDMAVTLLPESPTTSATVSRTLRAGRLHHIGLPQTLDLGNEAGHSYVVGQWVDGATLADLLAGGPLDGEVASSITGKIADAIAEAHRNGISLGAIHPSLVRVNFDGQVRLSHVISYAGATPDQDIRAIGGLLYLMLTGTYPLPQNGMSPPLPVAPTEGGRELPAEQVRADAPAGLAALAERTLHPDGAHGVRSADAIAVLLRDATIAPPVVEVAPPADGRPMLTASQLAERRVQRERRAKLSVAGVMLLVFTVLLAIVVGSVIKRVVDSVQDPQITEDQVLDRPTTTAAATSAGEDTAPAASGQPNSTAAETAAVVAAPVAITAGEVYDPEGQGAKDYTSYVDRAWDGDPSSAWQTFVYAQNFGPGGIKAGVGLMLTLERDVSPLTVTVATTTPGIKVEIRASDGNINAPVGSTPVLASSDVGNAPAAIAVANAPTSKYLIVFVTGLTGKDRTWQGTISDIKISAAPPA